MNSVLVILTTISLLVISVTETSLKEYSNQRYRNIEATDYEDYGCLNEPHEPESDNYIISSDVNIKYLNNRDSTH